MIPAPWEVIKKLEATNSRKDKEAILQSLLLYSPHDQEFWQGCNYALSPRMVFGVKQIPLSDNNGPGLPFVDFVETLRLLNSRGLTGHAALDYINHIMILSKKDQWNYWYRRILLKDLKCGVTETTINKIRPKTVPIFSCQLANDASSDDRKVGGKVILDYKLDGVRALAVIRKYPSGLLEHPNDVTIFSRNGKVFDNFTLIEEALLKLDIGDWGSVVLDGEITSTNFQKLMTQVNRKKNVDTSDAVFNVFDCIPLEDFHSGAHYCPQHSRRAGVEAILKQNTYDCVRPLPYIVADLGTADGIEKLEDLRTSARIRGLEGVMVKKYDAPYESKRNDNWLKIKPNISVDLAVIGFEEGTGRNLGRLGAMICEGEDMGRKIRVNVGSGYSDELRDDIWQNQEKLLGEIVEVRADAVSQNQDGTYSLRFPRFLRFRGFTPGEKI